MSDYYPIKFENETLVLIDQTKLPLEENYLSFKSLVGVHGAIRDMIVRGAPCIGFSAIFGMALWIKDNPDFQLNEFQKACDFLKTARPTAVNLAYEVDRVFQILKMNIDLETNLYDIVVNFGHEQLSSSEKLNRQMSLIAEGELDETLLKPSYKIMTHCNTGFLACGSIGTALGVVQNLHEKKKLENTWVDETRPYLQGSRLTAYELMKIGAPHKIVVEGAASYLMKNGLVDAIFTGADRIVANGDTANKIGTSNLAVIAHHYKVPFYIVAPSSSFDLKTPHGSGIEIEMRDPKEILEYCGNQIAPVCSTALNPSFDVTDGSLITGIISEKGIAKGNYLETLPRIVN